MTNQDNGRPYTSAERVIGLTARTAHLLAVATYLGGKLLDVPDERLTLWRRLVVASGSALMISEAAHSRNWPHQVRGVVALAHAATLAATHLSPRVGKAAVVAALVTGAAGSHAPKAIRRWSLLHHDVMP